jgi:hypothetical protein
MILLKMSVNDFFHDVNEIHTLGKLQLFDVKAGDTYSNHTGYRVNCPMLHHKETDLTVRPIICWIRHE